MTSSPDVPDGYRELVLTALAELGVKRLVVALQDVSFPSDRDEDVGRGSPYTAAAERFARFVRGLGFNGLQLGPQGQTSADNASPYDGTLFSRNVVSLPLRIFRDEAYRGLVADADLRGALGALGSGDARRADHASAHGRLHHLVHLAHEALDSGARPDVAARLDRFSAAHAGWLEPDALYDALRTSYGGKGFRDWPENGDRAFWCPESSARRDALVRTHARSLRRYALGQMLVHDAHARFRAATAGLTLYGDLQVGTSDADAWIYARSFLEGYVMGAPPSRTNPEGQPWRYQVLDPALFDGEAMRFFRARIDKAFADYDTVRVDHPHGLVCPWVYRDDDPDPAAAVRVGGRLFDSPDLGDHPDLARFARVRPDQIDHRVARFDDDWVTSLEPAQIDRYAIFFDALVAAAKRAGRHPSSLACEVLSTAPLPLMSVLDRHGLGRFRVTQKANLADPSDGYRSENAERPDWAMLGNHDTPPIFALVRAWDAARRARWADHLAERLRLDASERARVATDPGHLAQAMLAEIFACPAENVSVFFGDLFGFDESFNVPGLVHSDNWSLRLPWNFEALYLERVARGAALSLPLALAMALDARGAAPLAGKLHALARTLSPSLA